jgi:hypothetical protein
MIKLQLLAFESDLEQAQLARTQSLSDLRQLLGYESVSADYDVVTDFEYQPVKVNRSLTYCPNCTASIFSVCLLPCGHMKEIGLLNRCPSTEKIAPDG